MGLGLSFVRPEPPPSEPLPIPHVPFEGTLPVDLLHEIMLRSLWGCIVDRETYNERLHLASLARVCRREHVYFCLSGERVLLDMLRILPTCDYAWRYRIRIFDLLAAHVAHCCTPAQAVLSWGIKRTDTKDFHNALDTRLAVLASRADLPTSALAFAIQDAARPLTDLEAHKHRLPGDLLCYANSSLEYLAKPPERWTDLKVYQEDPVSQDHAQRAHAAWTDMRDTHWDLIFGCMKKPDGTYETMTMSSVFAIAGRIYLFLRKPWLLTSEHFMLALLRCLDEWNEARKRDSGSFWASSGYTCLHLYAAWRIDLLSDSSSKHALPNVEHLEERSTGRAIIQQIPIHNRITAMKHRVYTLVSTWNNFGTGQYISGEVRWSTIAQKARDHSDNLKRIRQHLKDRAIVLCFKPINVLQSKAEVNAHDEAFLIPYY
jgi:hypothetical protein